MSTLPRDFFSIVLKQGDVTTDEQADRLSSNVSAIGAISSADRSQRSAVTDPASPEPLRYERTYSVGRQFADRIASVSFRRSLTRPRRLLQIGVFGIVMGALCGAEGIYIGQKFEIFTVVGIIGQTFAIVTVAIGVLGAVLLAFLFNFIRVRDRLREQLPEGTVFSVGFTETRMVVRTTLTSSEISYEIFSSWAQDRDVILLYRRASAVPAILPIQCFSQESLAWLTAKITPTGIAP
ncbi:MAG: hypothetical protein JWQ12_2340 [Glaciihabitans sp.]|nr:hypothetical protein [Glaciihabitans sp.]